MILTVIITKLMIMLRKVKKMKENMLAVVLIQIKNL